MFYSELVQSLAYSVHSLLFHIVTKCEVLPSCTKLLYIRPHYDWHIFCPVYLQFKFLVVHYSLLLLLDFTVVVYSASIASMRVRFTLSSGVAKNNFTCIRKNDASWPFSFLPDIRSSFSVMASLSLSSK